MKGFWENKLFFTAAVIFLIIFADQIVKLVIVGLKIPKVCNTGVAFGLGQGLFGTFVPPLVLVLLLTFLVREKNSLSILGYLLIVGGGFSNLFDRLARGCVVDFINFKIWPSFNLADVLITIGVGLILIQFLNIKWLKQ